VMGSGETCKIQSCSIDVWTVAGHNFAFWRRSMILSEGDFVQGDFVRGDYVQGDFVRFPIH